MRMPEFYQTYLQSQLDRPSYLLLCLLVQVLQSVKQVRLETIATVLPLPIHFESRRRKVQRFLKLPQVSFATLWFPLVQAWVTQIYAPHALIHLAIDRTSWGAINLLVVSLIVDKRAIPLNIQLLHKLGSSNLSEQQQVMLPVLSLLSAHTVVVLGDREFCSVKLGNGLRQQGERVYFCLRLKRNESVEITQQLWLELSELGVVPGSCLYLNGVRVTKQQGFGYFNLACKWKGRYRGWQSVEGWFILTNLNTLEAALQSYQKRFSIEEMFRDWKGGGYNLEKTQLTGERLIALLVVMTIAYSRTTFQGQTLKKLGGQKYIGRVTEANRTQRRHSNFYIGVYGQLWSQYYQDCTEIVVELMQLNRNKWKFYRRGLRALELVLSTS